ncbi:MAG: carbohydrate ABC transporter permease [Anaerolineae bacterium]|nr:MAG: carbohydrate ABC transporter permease [Anaerolineae bacterium]
MGSKRRKLISDILVNGTLFLIVALWTIPTLGVLVSSFRTRFDIQTSGWWAIFPHKEWVKTSEMDIPDGIDPNGVMEILGATGTFQEFREGIQTPDGKRVTWVGNKRLGRIEVQEQRWTTRTDFTLDNYKQVLNGKSFELRNPDGSTTTVQGDNFVGAFLNSLTVTIPATVIPILIAAFAAYGFAWMRFPGRRLLFVLVVALLVVPLQTALVPILQDYVKLDLNGTFLAVWLAHTGFGLPLATYLLFNYINGLPRDILESAFIDGASHFTIFTRLILPLSVPALASFAIFQFLWVWNDYLVALVFIGAKPDVQVLTMRLAEMVGSRGNDWHLLTAGAFVSMALPLIVFFSLQRYFVRGLLAGSVKG